MKLRLCYTEKRVVDNIATGAAVRSSRLRDGLTLKQVAQRSGISVSYLSRLESGKATWDQATIDKLSVKSAR